MVASNICPGKGRIFLLLWSYANEFETCVEVYISMYLKLKMGLTNLKLVSIAKQACIYTISKPNGSKRANCTSMNILNSLSPSDLNSSSSTMILDMCYLNFTFSFLPALQTFLSGSFFHEPSKRSNIFPFFSSPVAYLRSGQFLGFQNVVLLLIPA